MPIQLASFLIPKAGNTYFLVEDTYIKGGLRVCTDETDRNAINPVSRKAGMLVVTKNNKKIWMLGDDLLGWTEFKGSGSGVGTRTNVSITTSLLTPGAVYNAEAVMSKACILYRLTVDAICTVQAYATADRAENNPYTFVALTNHLEDDGTIYLSNGQEVKGRRYTILMNLENPVGDKIYWKITNSGTTDATITLNIEYLPIE